MESFMVQKNESILIKLQEILNENTGKTLFSEDRFIGVAEESGKVKIIYKRDGISIVQKKKIEEQIIECLKDQFSPDDILVFTQSENMQNPVGSAGTHEKKVTQEKAQIQAGHGPAANRKRVSGVKKVIAVSSNKGGVGKSTVTVNLAFALKNLGLKVGILDADIYGPSQPMLLNQRGAKPQADENKKILPVMAYDLPFMSFGLFIPESDPVIWRGPMLGGVLNQFLFDVKWGDLDILLIDLPPGTGDMQLSLHQLTEIDGVIVVSTPQSVALLDAEKGLRMFQQVQVPVLGMIENMSYFVCNQCTKEHDIFGRQGVQAVAEKLKAPFLGEIPLTTDMREFSDAGTPLLSLEEKKTHPSFISYMKIAESVATGLNFSENLKTQGEASGSDAHKKGGLLAKFFGRAE
jgi:ATP-binding protein involved in chromosome partitioning